MKRVIIAGGAGYLGQVLVRFLADRGIGVAVLSRRAAEAPGAEVIRWDGAELGPWTASLEGADALINLCGRSVNCRYTRSNKESLLRSRTGPTRLLGEALRGLDRPPPVWINASTATIYAASLDEPMTESEGTLDRGFSASVAKAWENAFLEENCPGTRKVALRAGIVLGSGPNSALPALARLARLGFGGRIGSGRQMVSWIHEEDFARAVHFLADHPELDGPFNLTAPASVSNSVFMKALRDAAGRRLGFPTPERALRLGCALIRTEPELLLKSRYAHPERLLESRFLFRFPFIDEALADLLPAP